MIVTFVPETYELEGQDAKDVMEGIDRMELLKNSFVRFRYADGFSYARSVAFQVVLTLIPLTVVVVALSVRIGDARLQGVIEEIFRTITPGPSSDALVQTFEAAEDNARQNTIAILAGGVTAAIAGTTAMSQVQRGASRIYGVLEDRETLPRYLRAFSLMLSVGGLLGLGLLAIGFGTSLGGQFTGWLADLWQWVRWPVGAVLVGLGIAVLYRRAPNRHQPSIAWLTTGGYMATAVWLVLTFGLAMYLSSSSSFGDTYGPMAGLIGVMLWSQLSGIAILFGVAFTAQLEAVRAGVLEPLRDVDRPIDGDASGTSDGRSRE